jgi:putative glutamine amidotransferase
MLDGLVLPGGIDLDPIFYGKDNATSYGADPKKDTFERTVFHAFRKANKPIFGICRGFQLIICEYLKIKSGLNNFLHFEADIPHHNQVNDQQLDRSTYQHFVDCFPNILYGDPIKTTISIPVNSMHHQGLLVDFGKKDIIGAQGFKMVAWTTRGLKAKKEKFPVICEAFKISGWGSNILAVQWHPEELKDISLLHNFFLGNNNKEDNCVKSRGLNCADGKLNYDLKTG